MNLDLVWHDDFTLIRYDPALEYYMVNNWVLIGSLGDPETWKGGDVVARKKGDKDGLAGVLVDFNILQEILYQRPSGKRSNGKLYTHRL